MPKISKAQGPTFGEPDPSRAEAVPIIASFTETSDSDEIPETEVSLDTGDIEVIDGLGVDQDDASGDASGSGDELASDEI
jgi:hypothetical protein